MPEHGSAWRSRIAAATTSSRPPWLPELDHRRAIIVLGPLLLLAAFAWWSWRGVETEASDRVERISGTLAAHAEQLIELQETLLAAALLKVQGSGPEEISANPRVAAFLQQLEQRTLTSESLAIVELATGRTLVATGSPPGSVVDPSLQEVVRAHRERDMMTYVSAPYLGEVVRVPTTGKLAFTVSSRDSATGLIAVATIPIDVFTDFFARIRRSDIDVFNFTRADGAILARSPAAGDPVGARLPPDAMQFRFQRGELQKPFFWRSVVDSSDRLVQMRQVSGRPLFAFYGIDAAVLRADWLRQVVPMGLLALLASGGLLHLTSRIRLAAAEVATTRALADSEARFRALVALSSDWWWEQDEQFRFTSISGSFEQLTGWTPDSLIGTTRWAFPAMDVSEEQWAAHRAQLERHEPIRDFEFARPTAGDEAMWVSISGDPVFDAGGRFTGYRGTGRNITARKNAKLALAKLNAELEQRVAERTAAHAAEIERREAAQAALAQAQRMESIGRLAGGLAHDFNNALAVIAANLDLALPQVRDERTRDFIRRANDAIELSAGLNRRLLSFTRAGPLDARAIRIEDHIHDVARLVERTLGPDITVEVEVAGDLWPVRLDPGGLDSALLNLAVNARDAMPGGGKLKFSARNVPLDAAQSVATETPSGDHVCVSVRDDGVGMTPEVRRRATEPFFSTKPRASGTGLGLSIVSEFVAASGGTLTIDSEPGSGTVVSLLLPRATAPVVRVPRPASETEIALGDGEIVLLVDDNESLLEATSAMVEGLGYAVIVASNGVEAFGRLQGGEPIDLVLSDVAMPGGLSGYDVARRVLADRPGTAIVLVSGFHLDERPADGMPRGNFMLLRKPFTRVQLARALREALDARHQDNRSTSSANT